MIRNTRYLTEDLGKMFEKAICNVYNIPYCGNYKYDEEWPKSLSTRLTKLPELFATSCYHTARNGSPYDFTSTESDIMKTLSAKTIKKHNNKVAPQVIGQPTIEKLATYIGCNHDEQTVRDIVITNPDKLLSLMEKHTFDTDIIFYNKQSDRIKYIQHQTHIPWDTFTYQFTNDWRTSLKNSTGIKIHHNGKPITIVEVQIHNKSRKNMAIRWYFEKVLEIFNHHFKITELD